MSGRPNTPAEDRVIASAIAAGRVTYCPAGWAAGLTNIERELWLAWQLGRHLARLADAGRRGAWSRWAPLAGNSDRKADPRGERAALAAGPG